jgi:sulfide:quinone oxidoreductase
MNRSRKQVVVIGGSFGGLNAAYELRWQLGQTADITLISKDSRFTFVPSLPSVILGWREPGALQVPLEKPLRRKGVRFVHAAVEDTDLDKSEVATRTDRFRYDAALIASGAELNYDAVPGLGPESGYTHSTFTSSEAVRAKDALARVLAHDSGRWRQLHRPSVRTGDDDRHCAEASEEASSVLTYIAEPFLGHFGVGGIGASSRRVQDEFARRSIESVINAQISEARPDRVVLADRSQYLSDFSLVIPAFRGSAFVRTASGLEGRIHARHTAGNRQHDRVVLAN